MYRYAFSCRSLRAAAATAASSSSSASASQRCRLYDLSSACSFRTAAASPASQQQWCQLYGSPSCPSPTATAATTAAPSASQRCLLYDPSGVRREFRALPRPRTFAVAAIANRKYGSATTVAMRHIHRWCSPKLRGVDGSGAATTTAIKMRRGGDEQPKPASAGGKRADTKTCAGSFKRTSLQKRLGITKKEAETLRGDKRATAQGYSNLVGNPESCSGGGGGGGSSRSSSGEGLSTGPTSLSPFVDFLIDRLRSTKGDVKQLVLKNPGVLTMSAAGADGVSRWLEDHLGMKRREVARLLLKYPEAGQLSVEETIKPVIEWLRKTFSPKKSDVMMVLRQAPQILGQSVEGSLKPMVALLESVLGVSGEKAANVVYILPAIFIHSAENKRDPTLAWLSEQLSSGDLSAMIDAAPKYRGMNVEKELELSLAWLRDWEGLKREEMRRVVRGGPSTACGSSIKNRLDPILAWMKEDLGLDTNAGMAMLVRCPGIIKASLNLNLKLKLPWLKKTFGLTQEEAVALVIRCPMLLCLSAAKNLGPTTKFYRVEMGASNRDLVQYPRLLMSSLENRLRRRVATMKANNIKPSFPLHGRRINLLTNNKFEEFLSTEGTTS